MTSPQPIPPEAMKAAREVCQRLVCSHSTTVPCGTCARIASALVAFAQAAEEKGKRAFDLAVEWQKRAEAAEARAAAAEAEGRSSERRACVGTMGCVRCNGIEIGVRARQQRTEGDAK